MGNAFFITGTDTDAGKTTVAAGLLCAARRLGFSTLAIKPVASGCDLTAQGLRNSDALALAQHSSIKLPYTHINPFAFAPAIAPHLAAQLAGVKLNVETLQNACSQVLSQQADLTLIEGAGGWRVPISANQSMADLAKALQLPVILVVGVRLGCINHALLTAEAIARDGLELAGWVANYVEPDMPALAENLISLEQHLKTPCLAKIPWVEGADIEQIAEHLSAQIPQLLVVSGQD